VIPGPLTQAFMLPGSDVIILIDEFFQVHMIVHFDFVFPNTRLCYR
jgi:hypothetical protein